MPLALAERRLLHNLSDYLFKNYDFWFCKFECEVHNILYICYSIKFEFVTSY